MKYCTIVLVLRFYQQENKDSYVVIGQLMLYAPRCATNQLWTSNLLMDVLGLYACICSRMRSWAQPSVASLGRNESCGRQDADVVMSPSLRREARTLILESPQVPILLHCTTFTVTMGRNSGREREHFFQREREHYFVPSIT